jgi:hypothetical protein
VMLHSEHTGVVVELLPWGVLVRLADGTDVLVDNAKVGVANPDTGIVVRVVVLDDERTPMRGSCLDVDLDIGRRLRAGETSG